MRPFSTQTEQQNLQDSVTPNSVRSTMQVGSWLGAADSYNAASYYVISDTEYRQAVGGSLTTYSNLVPSETVANAYQGPSYLSADWTAGYQAMASGHTMHGPTDAEDNKDHATCGQVSATISTDQQPECDQSRDNLCSGITAKKIKQERQTRTEHGRRTSHAASRRASTGSLLWTNTLDPVSSTAAFSLHFVVDYSKLHLLLVC